jgi:hypothetical protein
MPASSPPLIVWRRGARRQNYLAPAFQFGLYVGEHQLGKLDVLIGAVVARAGHYFGPLHRPAKVSDLLGALVQQQHDYTALRRTLADCLDYLFEKNGLARLGRRDDQLTRAFAYRRYQVNYAHALPAASA